MGGEIIWLCTKKLAKKTWPRREQRSLWGRLNVFGETGREDISFHLVSCATFVQIFISPVITGSRTQIGLDVSYISAVEAQIDILILLFAFNLNNVFNATQKLLFHNSAEMQGGTQWWSWHGSTPWRTRRSLCCRKDHGTVPTHHPAWVGTWPLYGLCVGKAS